MSQDAIQRLQYWSIRRYKDFITQGVRKEEGYEHAIDTTSLTSPLWVRE